MNKLFKICLVLFLALTSNQVMTSLYVSPSTLELGQQIRMVAYAFFLGVVIACIYSLFFKRSRLIVAAIGGCVLACTFYPLYLIGSAALYGMSKSVPIMIYGFLLLCTTVLIFAVREYANLDGEANSGGFNWIQIMVGLFFLSSTTLIVFSGLFGVFSSAFLNYNASFLYLVFIILLIAIWFSKALSFVPGLIML